MRKCSSHSLKTACFVAFALMSSFFGQRKSVLSCVLQRVQKNCRSVERRRGVGILPVSHNSAGEKSPLRSKPLNERNGLITTFETPFSIKCPTLHPEWMVG